MLKATSALHLIHHHWSGILPSGLSCKRAFKINVGNSGKGWVCANEGDVLEGKAMYHFANTVWLQDPVLLSDMNACVVTTTNEGCSKTQINLRDAAVAGGDFDHDLSHGSSNFQLPGPHCSVMLLGGSEQGYYRKHILYIKREMICWLDYFFGSLRRAALRYVLGGGWEGWLAGRQVKVSLSLVDWPKCVGGLSVGS